jgi:myo-inositol 2-dehydrogenase/D-chiro-inositol 1-dehydrogenase
VFETAKLMAERYETIAFPDFDSIVHHFQLLPMVVSPKKDSHSQRGLDAIIISVPTDSHGLYIRDAVKYGLGIFVEKPVAETPDEICELYDLCSAMSVPLCCGFQRRFDPSYVEAARAVQHHKIGDRPISCHIFFGDSPGPPIEFLKSVGGEIFMDLCVHGTFTTAIVVAVVISSFELLTLRSFFPLFSPSYMVDVDFIQWALQDEIESVYAVATSSTDELKDCGVQDNATMMMTTRKYKTVITLSMSRRAVYGYDQTCEIFGNGGKVKVGNRHETTTCLSNTAGDHLSRLQNSYDSRFSEAFRLELDTFADVMLMGQFGDNNNQRWPVGKDDVISVQRVAKAAKESFEKGTVIYL